jgi:CheY-like chemotaxis protein
MLVVESAPKRIEDLSHHLLELGYRVAIARSGTEALEKIRRLQPAAVFLNPILPLLSGWDVLTLLKTDAETCHIPVVITATRADREQTFQNGGNAFLSLPIRSEALQQCIDRLAQVTSDHSDESPPSITVLYLNGTSQLVNDLAETQGTLPASDLRDLTSLLHPYHCRVLEVEDIEQADLLAQVWKPNVMLLDGEFSNPLGYAKQLSAYPALSALPMVTLTVEMTHAANLVSGLSVFPCLAATETQTPPDPNFDAQTASALWQVIQVAAGIHWTPHILIADLSALETNWALSTPSDLHQSVQPGVDATKLPNATQALVQYMQIAGFRSSVGHSWQQVVQQLEHHSVDLLLFCLYSPSNLHPLFLDIIYTIEHLTPKPPILVWNCCTEPTEISPEAVRQLEARWSRIATEILPTSLSMPDLLARINQILTNR